MHSARSEQISMDHDQLNWYSNDRSDEDDESTITGHEQSDVSTTVEEPDTTGRVCGKASTSGSSYGQKSPRRDFHEQRPSYGRNAHEHRRENRNRFLPLRLYQLDMTAAKNALSAKRAWSQCAGNDESQVWEKRCRMHRIDDDELYSRLLDCEARIEQRERALARQTQILRNTVTETSLLRRSRTFWDFSSMRHCGCRCPRSAKIGNLN